MQNQQVTSCVIPLTQALLCLNCDVITDDTRGCPKCGGNADFLVPLAKWMPTLGWGEKSKEVE